MLPGNNFICKKMCKKIHLESIFKSVRSCSKTRGTENSGIINYIIKFISFTDLLYYPGRLPQFAEIAPV